MKTLTKNTVSAVGHPKNSRPAVVEVFDIKFRDIFETPGDGVAKRAIVYKMKIRAAVAPHRVLLSPEDGSLIVKDKGATIQFAFRQKEYYPLAIAFTLENGKGRVGDAKRLGQLNFSQAKIKPGDHSLFITDVFMDKATDASYSFSIIIQRAKDGKIGILDCRAAPSGRKPPVIKPTISARITDDTRPGNP